MTDTDKLLEIMNNSGYKRAYIANYCGLTPAGLMNKVNNKGDFKASEIQKLSSLLKLSVAQREAIFFAGLVANIATSSGKES